MSFTTYSCLSFGTQAKGNSLGRRPTTVLVPEYEMGAEATRILLASTGPGTTATGPPAAKVLPMFLREGDTVAPASR